MLDQLALCWLRPNDWVIFGMYFRITLWWLFDSYVWIGFEMTLEWFWNNFEMTSTCSVCSSCSERWIDVALIFICFHVNLVSNTILFRVFNKWDQCYDYLTGFNFRCTFSIKVFAGKKASNICGLLDKLTKTS